MQIHVPDPNFTSSDRAETNFALALKIAVCFITLLWLIYWLSWMLSLDLKPLGVNPRRLDGLLGILSAPLVHGNLAHLVSNSVPLFVLMTGMLYLYPSSAWRVIPAVYFGAGIAVWLFARASVHLGSSGLIYGLVTYIFVGGLLRRDKRAIAASLLVCFLYGSLAWGVLPIQVGVSWETHLAAAVIGLLSALYLRRLDIPPRKRYSWEEEDENDG